MSTYAQFGLDTVKKSKDEATIAKQQYDPWIQQLVTGRNFYLCFSNWVISRTTIEAFQRQEPVESIPGDQCQKCMKKPPKMHYAIDGLEFEGGIELGICPDCLKAAASYLMPSHYSNSYSKMSFFQNLAALGLTGDLKLVVTNTTPGQMAVSLLLANEKCGDDARKMIAPLLLTGTPRGTRRWFLRHDRRATSANVGPDDEHGAIPETAGFCQKSRCHEQIDDCYH